MKITIKKLIISLCIVLTFNGFAQQAQLSPTEIKSSSSISFDTNLRPEPSDNSVESNLIGRAVSISNNRIAVGALSTQNKISTGAVYIFEFDGSNWTQTAEITQNDSQDDDFFAGAISLDGDRLAVGAYGMDETEVNAGAVYVYVYDGMNWILEQKFSPNIQVQDEYFGISIKLQGDRILIGATSLNSTGAAYVFELENDSWTEQQKIISTDIEPSDLFGLSLDLDNDRAIIGAYYNDTFNGAAYVFDYDGKTWTETEKITYDLFPGADYFGRAVSLSGDTAMISSTLHDNSGGAVYVYELIDNEWQQTQRLNRLVGSSFNAFGVNIDLKDDLALIGAPRFEDDLIEYGAAYVFKKTGTSWQQIALVRDVNSGHGDRFGQSIGLSSEKVVVGATVANTNGPASGAAQVFDLDDKLIFLNGFNEAALDCFGVERPMGLIPVNGSYQFFNDGFGFGESTNSRFLAPVSTNEYLSLAEFSFSDADTRRRIVFNDAPTSENLIDEATISISQCPGDFTESATCVIPVNNNSNVFFSTRPSDLGDPLYCVLDPEKSYYFNLIMSPDPFNTIPSCDEPTDTQCSAFYAEALMN
ncbi:hypothetical protein OS175_12480 [Marinicella sp. S1101]|uniref:hypothetical protein n=1 Tax=Marinicella marina TaxID=2996016 RepID=UPI002260BBC6|nr:hypothetical protein [Marinicella marina]MCX7554698.1 hypothetical protein [Marinicella marina]MDJ1141486.1 hypothetical protein [Marinicella marina]